MVIRRLIEKDGLTVLLVEQKLPFAPKYAARFAILARGRRVAEGSIEKLSDELIRKHRTMLKRFWASPLTFQKIRFNTLLVDNPLAELLFFEA